jgi:aryl-alcohol dehydrogenase-like predicted oxidoreductase
MNLRPGPLSPRLALGCAQFGNLYRARGEEEAAAILEEAWNAGIRLFDTAPHYGPGLSERRPGAFLRGKPRDQFSVSTKVGRLPRRETPRCRLGGPHGRLAAAGAGTPKSAQAPGVG